MLYVCIVKKQEILCKKQPTGGGEKLVDTEQLKKLRCAKSYFSATEFARAVGMSPRNYGNRERGKVKFSADEIVKVCEVLGISLEEGINVLL